MNAGCASQRLDRLPVVRAMEQRLCVVTAAAPAQEKPVRPVLPPVLAAQMHGREALRTLRQHGTRMATRARRRGSGHRGRTITDHTPGHVRLNLFELATGIPVFSDRLR